jgi:hypothetical protein
LGRFEKIKSVLITVHTKADGILYPEGLAAAKHFPNWPKVIETESQSPGRLHFIVASRD